MSLFVRVKVSNSPLKGNKQQMPPFCILPAGLFPPQQLLLLIANAWKGEVPNLLSHFLKMLNGKEIKRFVWTFQVFSSLLEKKKISVQLYAHVQNKLVPHLFM